MKTFLVPPSDADRRLDRFAARVLPSVGAGLIQKYIRLKKIKVDSKAQKADYRLKAGERVDIYLADDCFSPGEKPDRLYEGFKEHIWVVYEDADVLIVNKRPGLICHPDENEKVNTLLTHVRAYLYHRGEWSGLKSDFAPELCNRLDRFTGGLVIAAKNKAALDGVNDAIRRRAISKRYLCVCHSRPRPPSGEISNYLVQSGTRVAVSDVPVPGGKLSVTRFRTLETRNGLSLVELDLITGRTHQIRAQMAHAKCPVLGDASYGFKDDLKRYGRGYQALYAVGLAFGTGVSEGLDGREFSVEAPFVDEYFPAR